MGEAIVIRWIFFRLLGGIYLIAFASLAVQVTGLVGKEGILSASGFLAAVKRSLGRRAYFFYPTLGWIDASDTSLRLLCGAGMALSVMLIFGLQTTPVLALLWVLYLSLVTVGQVFLSFQWDALLLEAGFLAIFLVPPSLTPGQAAGPPSPWIFFLFRWLLFRLMFMSGVLKLTSGDPTWRNLTAMAHHYETQPLPSPLAWTMHRLPLSFQKASTLFTLAVEILVPVFFFFPEPVGMLAAGITILLQILIMLTGNFAFFNLLAIVLTVFLFDDRFAWMALPLQVAGWVVSPAPGASVAVFSTAAGILLTMVSVAIGSLFLLRPWIRSSHFFRVVQPVVLLISAYRLVNSYGLFTVMTTQRPEIILEGSKDGTDWQPYEFKYKPGDPQRPPPVVAPHQPRLDWQVWFAALSSVETNPWFMNLIVRLLEGSPEVLGLLERNPFPEKPPLYVRAFLYDYHFSTPAERAQSGRWWDREALGYYLPSVSISGQGASA